MVATAMKCEEIIGAFHSEVISNSAGLIENPDDAVLSAPSPELVELIAWNVGVSFIVNLLASLGYDYLRSKFTYTPTH